MLDGPATAAKKLAYTGAKIARAR